MRWMDPERGLVYPGEFIHLAERTGMINQISDWVVTEACRQSRAWRDKGVRRRRFGQLAADPVAAGDGREASQ